MSVLINATTTQGLLVTPDNSGQIQFQLNGVNVPSPTVAPTFSAYQTSGGQSIPNGTGTKVQFQSKEWDTANCFDATTNYRYTPNVAGYYQVNCQISYNSFTPSETEVQIYKNGSAVKRGNRFNAVGAPYLVVSALIYLNGSTDYIEIYLYSATSTTTGYGINYAYFNGSMTRSA